MCEPKLLTGIARRPIAQSLMAVLGRVADTLPGAGHRRAVKRSVRAQNELGGRRWTKTSGPLHLEHVLSRVPEAIKNSSVSD